MRDTTICGDCVNGVSLDESNMIYCNIDGQFHRTENNSYCRYYEKRQTAMKSDISTGIKIKLWTEWNGGFARGDCQRNNLLLRL